MTEPITVTLSNALSQRVQKVAEQRQEDIIAVVERLLAEALPESFDQQADIDLSEPDAAADREMQAYIDLHPMLKEKYLGKHVAIYGGNLIDVDEDFDALYDRIDQTYPDQFVWMSKVQEEPIETFVIRSPRFVEDE